MTDSDAAGTRPIQPSWPDAEVSQLLHEFGDQLAINIEIRDDHVEIIARPRRDIPVATGRSPAELREKLIARGFIPWT